MKKVGTFTTEFRKKLSRFFPKGHPIQTHWRFYKNEVMEDFCRWNKEPPTMSGMHVIKRNGQRERVSFDRITDRISSLCYQLENVDPIVIAKETIQSMYDGIATTELDTLSADICASHSQHAPDYNLLGGRILASNLAKETPERYLDVVQRMTSIVSADFLQFVERHADTIQSFFDYSRDMMFDYFAIKTLERSYLFRVNGVIVERPQHVWMRVAIQLHGLTGTADEATALTRIQETYNGISRLEFTHATPTLFNSGTHRPQLSSCFLYSSEDNIESIFKTVSDTARISKWAGGIGLSLSNIRAKGSIIRGTNGKSEGIVPLCKTLEQTARYINQGGKRSGSIAIYLEPWHADVMSFVELRKNTGDENLRTRDLFLALWVPDLFMKRVEEDGEWSLMCPDECPGLVDSYGKEFEERYLRYESAGTVRRRIRAREVWDRILENQIETGMPYMAFKDNVNSRNMQSQLGVIRNSNLCCEIQLYSDSSHYAVCNLASICLPRFVDLDTKTFNFDRLVEVAGIVTRNLNHVIDVNFYPVPETRVTNMASRPIGIGVQGLADVYHLLGLPFGSEKARQLNREIFEAIYYGSVRMSIELAKQDGVYPTYAGSPHSEGRLQFDYWNVDASTLRYDWKAVKAEMMVHGMRNSVLTALMPTASTSQIMGNTECFEPVTSNLYLRKTIAGEFTVVNRNLIRALSSRGLWTKEIYEEMLHDNGSIQRIASIPQEVKEVYKTAYELKVTDLLKQAIERSPFVDQMQSMNLFMEKPNQKILTNSHFYGWKAGLKTGMYYLRTQPAADPIKFGLDVLSVRRIREDRKRAVEKMVAQTGACPRDEALRALCDSCSS